MARVGSSSAAIAAAAAVVIFSCFLEVSPASFTIDYDKDSFYMDGKPFRYVSGSVHYFRVPREYWRDRLRKMKAAGLNAISTYVEWSQHEAKPGVYDFSRNLDLVRFIKLAQEENLYVILRPGPYICAEREMGGLPFWLLHIHPDVYLRTKDPKYTAYVERWLNILMAQLSPLLYGRGGPVILVQVENEYGSYGACDMEYLVWLRDLFKSHVRDDAVLFTTDGAGQGYLKCGKIPGVYATVDFGPTEDVKTPFRAQRKFEPKGPLVNSEYYPGWLTHWGERMARKNASEVTRSLRKMLDMGANVNFYVFHGGTNFGFTAGANHGSTYTPDITSYDYDAPISEAGDLTGKYFAIQNVLKKYLPVDGKINVSTSEKGDYGEVELTAVASLLSPKVKDFLGVTYRGTKPLTFEALFQYSGYLLYETEIQHSDEDTHLHVPGIHDLGNVYINGEYRGTLSRELKVYGLHLQGVKQGDRLSLVVENLGRINFGQHLNDTKGVTSGSVLLGGRALSPWNMTSFELRSVRPVRHCLPANGAGGDCLAGGGYAFYAGTFTAPRGPNSSHPLDSFLDVSHLTKGVVFVNDRNLGRYWSTRGPQLSLYVPGVYLKVEPEENVLVVIDEYISSPGIKVRFSKNPIFLYERYPSDNMH